VSGRAQHTGASARRGAVGDHEDEEAGPSAEAAAAVRRAAAKRPTGRRSAGDKDPDFVPGSRRAASGTDKSDDEESEGEGKLQPLAAAPVVGKNRTFSSRFAEVKAADIQVPSLTVRGLDDLDVAVFAAKIAPSGYDWGLG